MNPEIKRPKINVKNESMHRVVTLEQYVLFLEQEIDTMNSRITKLERNDKSKDKDVSSEFLKVCLASRMKKQRKKQKFQWKKTPLSIP